MVHRSAPPYSDDGSCAAVRARVIYMVLQLAEMNATVPSVVRASVMLTDTMVLIATWVKTADMWRASRQIKHFKPKLTTLLLRDGKSLKTLLLHTPVSSSRRIIGTLYFGYVPNGTASVYHSLIKLGNSVLCLANFIALVLDVLLLYYPWLSEATYFVLTSET